MNTRIRAASSLAIGVIGLATATACSSSDQSSDSPTRSSSSSSPSSPSEDPGSKTSATITIKDYKYGGATSVPARAMITVTNDDSEAHTVTSDTSGAFDVKIAPGQSATFTAPSKPGSFPYHCTYHGNMHGTLKVG